MKLDDIKPYVRYAKILKMGADYSTRDMRAYDNRLLYFFSGNAKLEIDGTEYFPERGQCFIWTPDSVYSLTAQGDDGFTVLVVNFDYTFGARKISLCLPPATKDNFDEAQRPEKIEFSDVPEFNAPLFIKDMHNNEYDFHCLEKEFVSPQRNYAAMLSAIMQKILLICARQSGARLNVGSSSLVVSVIDYIHENYASDLSNATIGLHFNYHPNYINRCMLANTGQSLHQYVVNARVLKALELLQTTDLSVTEISRAVGFKSIKHFSQSFKRCYNYSPTHFR
ncbi:MAG: helix-turn-helix transcriptional regulator [Clostridia bacterium]|nr:helix-turn-helix transcriptional regulator [Clostridia bacterium]